MRCWDHSAFEHLLHRESGRLLTLRLINPNLDQLRSNQIGRNGAKLMSMSRPANQVVDCISCQPTGVHEVGKIDSLRSAIR